MEKYQDVERSAVELFRSVSANRHIADTDLCRVALLLAHVWASRKAEAEASALIAELSYIDTKLLTKLCGFFAKLCAVPVNGGQLKKPDVPIIRISKGMLTHIDFQACWYIKEKYGKDAQKASQRIKLSWYKEQESLSVFAVRDRLAKLYKSTSDSKARNAIELALRDLGYPCPLDGKGHK